LTDAPLAGDLFEGTIVERQQCAPELCVLNPEFGLESDVQAVVEEDELGVAGGETAEQDVARVRVAVDEAPEEGLCGEEVEHCGHYFFEGEAEAGVGAGAEELGGAVGFKGGDWGR
ncbi:hypothetical protein V496_10199, partial [Pseudogymnoascus sp. VKM F-4515 (FW-2607)]